jgi:hypothetical protein
MESGFSMQVPGGLAVVLLHLAPREMSPLSRLSKLFKVRGGQKALISKNSCRPGAFWIRFWWSSAVPCPTAAQMPVRHVNFSKTISAAVAINRAGVRPRQVIDKAEKELKIKSIFRLKIAFLGVKIEIINSLYKFHLYTNI